MTTEPFGTRSSGLTGALLTVVTGLAGLGGVGCDQDVAATYAARTKLAQAADLVAEAQESFSGGEGVDPDAQRTAKLTEARTRLTDLVGGVEDPITRAGALRLLADVRIAGAREQIRAANAAFAKLSVSGANLSHQLATIDSINHVILAHTGDGRSVAQALEQGAATIATSRKAVMQRLAELGARREAQIEAARAAHERSAAALEQARQADEIGFATDNVAEKEKALRAAYAAQIRGEADRLEAQVAQVAAERIASEQTPLQSELGLWDRMAERLAALQEEHREEASARRDAHSAGEQNRTVELGGLEQAWAELSAQYDTTVLAQLEVAVNETQQALEEYRQAGDLTPANGGRKSVRFGRFTAEIELINALTQRITTTAAFLAQGEGIAASPALNGADAAAYNSGHEALKIEAAEATEWVTKLIAEGREYAGELVSDPQLGAASVTFLQALDGYAARLPG